MTGEGPRSAARPGERGSLGPAPGCTGRPWGRSRRLSCRLRVRTARPPRSEVGAWNVLGRFRAARDIFRRARRGTAGGHAGAGCGAPGFFRDLAGWPDCDAAAVAPLRCGRLPGGGESGNRGAAVGCFCVGRWKGSCREMQRASQGTGAPRYSRGLVSGRPHLGRRAPRSDPRGPRWPRISCDRGS